MGKRLTGKQRRFVDAYIVCLNATEAARRAGYNGDERSLAVIGSENLRNVDILTAMDRCLNAYAMSANEVLSHLTDIARGDIADAMNGMGGIDLTEARRRGKSHLVKKFKVRSITTDDQEIIEGEVEMYSRLEALNLLAKYHDLVNRVRVEDWHSEAIADIRAGRITYEALARAFDDSLATELFRSAGVQVSLTEGERSE